MEVIDSGLDVTPAQIVRVAFQEDVDLVGSLALSGAPMTHFKRIFKQLGAEEANVTLIVVGIVPAGEIPVLERLEAVRIVPRGSHTHEIVDWIHRALAEQERR